MSVTKILIGFLISLFLSLKIAASEQWIPDYCLEQNYQKSDINCFSGLDQSFSIENYSSFFHINNSVVTQELQQNLKNMAMYELLKQKSDLLMMYPELEKTSSQNVYERYAYSRRKDGTWFIRKQFSGQYDRCLKDEGQELLLQVEKLDEGMDQRRENFLAQGRLSLADGKVLNPSEKSKRMATILLGALAAEKQIEQRPSLVDEIEDLESKQERLEEILSIDQSYYTSSRCRGHMGRNDQTKCEVSRNPSLKEKYQVELNEVEQKLTALKQKKDITDKAVFANPYYVDDKLIGASYKPSQLVVEGLKTLREKMSQDEIQNILESLKNPESFKQKYAVSPEAMATAAIEKLMLSNTNIYQKIDELIQKETVKHIGELDESLEEICDSGEEFLYKIPRLVAKAESYYLQMAKEHMDPKDSLNTYLESHQAAHCLLIEENKEGRGQIYSQLAGGALVLGSGIAAGFGCVPCLYFAVGGGAMLTGVGLQKTWQKDALADTSLGLSHVGLADYEQARQQLNSARFSWAMSVADIALVPVGLKLGQFAKIQKLTSHGQRSLQRSGLGQNQDFIESLTQSLPEEKYLDLISRINQQPLSTQVKMQEELASLGEKSQLEKLAMIEQTMKKYQIRFPSTKELNRSVLKKLEAHPEHLAIIKKRYADKLAQEDFVAGSIEEKLALKALGILENKGCAGICENISRSPSEVWDEFIRFGNSCAL